MPSWSRIPTGELATVASRQPDKWLDKARRSWMLQFASDNNNNDNNQQQIPEPRWLLGAAQPKSRAWWPLFGSRTIFEIWAALWRIAAHRVTQLKPSQLGRCSSTGFRLGRLVDHSNRVWQVGCLFEAPRAISESGRDSSLSCQQCRQAEQATKSSNSTTKRKANPSLASTMKANKPRVLASKRRLHRAATRYEPQ